MSNIHTLYREPTTRTAKDTKTGATHRIEVTVHEVLDYDRDRRAYVVSETAGVQTVSRREFRAPGYMADNCGETAYREAMGLARELRTA